MLGGATYSELRAAYVEGKEYGLEQGAAEQVGRGWRECRGERGGRGGRESTAVWLGSTPQP